MKAHSTCPRNHMNAIVLACLKIRAWPVVPSQPLRSSEI